MAFCGPGQAVLRCSQLRCQAIASEVHWLRDMHIFAPISENSGHARALLCLGILHTRVIICQSPSWVDRNFFLVGSKGESIQQNRHPSHARHLASRMHSAPTKRWGLESRARFSRRSASASKRASACPRADHSKCVFSMRRMRERMPGRQARQNRTPLTPRQTRSRQDTEAQDAWKASRQLSSTSEHAHLCTWRAVCPAQGLSSPLPSACSKLPRHHPHRH